MLDHEPIFFVHVMKTAGTSFHFYMRQNLTRQGMYPDPDEGVTSRWMLDELQAIPPERRANLRGYSGHFPAFAADLVGAKRTVTILRDPVERTISLLKHRQRVHPVPVELEEIYDDPEFVRAFVENHQTKVFALGPEDEPASYMHLVEIDRARLEAAKERFAAIDVVGLQEEFTSFMKRAEDAFAWDPPKAAWWAWPSEEVSVSDELRRRIEDAVRWDFEFYEFAREEVARRQ